MRCNIHAQCVIPSGRSMSYRCSVRTEEFTQHTTESNVQEALVLCQVPYKWCQVFSEGQPIQIFKSSRRSTHTSLLSKLSPMISPLKACLMLLKQAITSHRIYFGQLSWGILTVSNKYARLYVFVTLNNLLVYTFLTVTCINRCSYVFNKKFHP